MIPRNDTQLWSKTMLVPDILLLGFPYVSLVEDTESLAGYILITILYFTNIDCFSTLVTIYVENPQTGGGEWKSTLS